MLIVTARSKGLRKFIPQPDSYAERYGRFTLTARDVEILEAVHRYRYLEARHIRALVGGSGQQITRRLQGLFHNGYVGRYARRERMRLELDPGAPLIAYGLELHGARALERRRGADAANPVAGVEQVRWKKEYTRRTEWFLEHYLMVSNFRCVLEVALRETPNTELVTWSQGKDTWFRVSTSGQRRRVVRVAPDAYFALRQGEQLRHFYLEADRGTEEHRRIAEKFLGYWKRLQEIRINDSRQELQRFNVLILTTGRHRQSSLMQTLADMGRPSAASDIGRGSFLFAVEPDVSLEAPSRILDSAWLRALRSTGDPIFQPSTLRPNTDV